VYLYVSAKVSNKEFCCALGMVAVVPASHGTRTTGSIQAVVYPIESVYCHIRILLGEILGSVMRSVEYALVTHKEMGQG